MIVIGVLIVLGGLAFVVVVRRRRARDDAGRETGAGPAGPAKEAW